MAMRDVSIKERSNACRARSAASAERKPTKPNWRGLPSFAAHHLDVRHLDGLVGLKVLAEAALVAVLWDIFHADAGGG